MSELSTHISNSIEVAIAVPNADSFRSEMVRTLALITFYQGAAGRQVKLIFPEGPYLDFNANEAMRVAKESESDWLFFMEIDMEYLLNADIIGYMIECGKDVLAGVYYQGVFPYRPIVYNFTENGLIANFDVIPDGLFRCDAVGQGFLLLSKKVIQAFTDEVIEKIGNPFDYVIEGNKIRLRQDPAFCWRLKQLGFEVWAHSGIPLMHIKKHQIGPGQFETAKRMIEQGVV